MQPKPLREEGRGQPVVQILQGCPAPAVRGAGLAARAGGLHHPQHLLVTALKGVTYSVFPISKLDGQATIFLPADWRKRRGDDKRRRGKKQEGRRGKEKERRGKVNQQRDEET